MPSSEEVLAHDEELSTDDLLGKQCVLRGRRLGREMFRRGGAFRKKSNTLSATTVVLPSAPTAPTAVPAPVPAPQIAPSTGIMRVQSGLGTGRVMGIGGCKIGVGWEVADSTALRGATRRNAPWLPGFLVMQAEIFARLLLEEEARDMELPGLSVQVMQDASRAACSRYAAHLANLALFELDFGRRKEVGQQAAVVRAAVAQGVEQAAITATTTLASDVVAKISERWQKTFARRPMAAAIDQRACSNAASPPPSEITNPFGPTAPDSAAAEAAAASAAASASTGISQTGRALAGAAQAAKKALEQGISEEATGRSWEWIEPYISSVLRTDSLNVAGFRPHRDPFLRSPLPSALDAEFGVDPSPLVLFKPHVTAQAPQSQGQQEQQHSIDASAENTLAPVLQSEAALSAALRLRRIYMRGLNGIFVGGGSCCSSSVADGTTDAVKKACRREMAIAHVARAAQFDGDWGPFLIVVPTGSLSAWQSTFAECAPALRVMPYVGSPAALARMRAFLTPRALHSQQAAAHVVLTTYGLFNAEEALFASPARTGQRGGEVDADPALGGAMCWQSIIIDADIGEDMLPHLMSSRDSVNLLMVKASKKDGVEPEERLYDVRPPLQKLDHFLLDWPKLLAQRSRHMLLLIPSLPIEKTPWVPAANTTLGNTKAQPQRGGVDSLFLLQFLLPGIFDTEQCDDWEAAWARIPVHDHGRLRALLCPFVVFFDETAKVQDTSLRTSYCQLLDLKADNAGEPDASSASQTKSRARRRIEATQGSVPIAGPQSATELEVYRMYLPLCGVDFDEVTQSLRLLSPPPALLPALRAVRELSQGGGEVAVAKRKAVAQIAVHLRQASKMLQSLLHGTFRRGGPMGVQWETTTDMARRFHQQARSVSTKGRSNEMARRMLQARKGEDVDKGAKKRKKLQIEAGGGVGAISKRGRPQKQAKQSSASDGSADNSSGTTVALAKSGASTPKLVVRLKTVAKRSK